MPNRSVFIGLLALLLGGCSSNPPIPMETVELAFDVPSAGWSLSPLEAWESDDAIHCLFQLTPPEGMAASVISKVRASMRIPQSTKPKRRIVFGKTWNWGSEAEIEFAKDLDSFRADLSSRAKRLEIETAPPNED